MRKILAALALAAMATTATACGKRQVEVGSPAPATAETSVRLTNNLSQAVNVYVTVGGSDMFLRQVSAGSSESLSVRGVAAGSSVTLKATTVDGTRTYTKDNVTLSSTTAWQLP